MKHIFTLLFFLSVLITSYGQVYIDEFDDGVESNVNLGNGYSSNEVDGEWTITGDGTGGAFEVFSITPNNDDGTPAIVDISENNKVFIRAKASNLGTQLRLDVRDAAGYATTLAGLTSTLVSDYTVFEFDFSNNLNDGGYGGTSCMSADAPCPVDPTQIAQFDFYVNPGQGNFAGSIVLDYLAVGSAPGVGPASDVWQEHFDDEKGLGFMDAPDVGLVNSISGSNWIISGDGNGGMWNPVSLLFYNQVTLDTTDISTADGDDKVFIRMRTNTPGTTVRLDLQDINVMATTAASITKPISDEWVTYEYNFSGGYSDLGFGGTGCNMDQAPCPVDADRIGNMILFVNPGTGAFVGDVEIDYISVGTALEEDPNAEGELVYGDHFSDGDNYVSTTAALDLSVEESILNIKGDGLSTPFSAVAYSIHDMDTGEGSIVDASGNNKIYVRVKTDVANTLLRIDLVDTAGFLTTQASLTKLLDTEFAILEYDFTGQYLDGGYGGTSCESADAPCPVDPTTISTILFYPNPADGGFDGCIEIDFISFGAPMGEDIEPYVDEFDNDNSDQWADAAGFTVEETGGELILIGDGTSGAYTSFNYTTHDTDNNTPKIIDMTSNNKLYVKAKSTIAGVPLRIDLVDQDGFASTEPATLATVNEEYEILEFDFTGTYTDGGYGGTACTTGPCPVDGTVISNMLFYIDPDNGGYDGTMTIDWISSINPLEDLDNEGNGPIGIDEYADDMEDNSLDFISDVDGVQTVAEDGQLKMIGDGTSGEFAPVLYELHDGLDTVVVNAESNEGKVFIRARSTIDGLPLRIDLQDNSGFLTSLAGLTQNMSTEFTTYEFNFTGNYSDGGYGGTACENGPCPVDENRIQQLLFYLNPGVGGVNGELHIDWISFGQPIDVDNVIDLNSLNSAKIFPNPASDIVSLQFNTQFSNSARISVHDVSGKLVYQENLGRLNAGINAVELNVSDQRQGIYFIQLYLDNQLAMVDKLMIIK